MSLVRALKSPERRNEIAADAVHEAEAAIADRGGINGTAAKLGLDTINRLRPGFLQRHVHALLPGWAEVLEPYWQEADSQRGLAAHLVEHNTVVADALLAVTDEYVSRASDAKAIAAYNHLRPRANERVAEQMPRIASFVERHT